MSDLNTTAGLLSVAVGIGLAAAAGLRVFLPLLVLSLAAREGWVELSPGFEWLATMPALIALATAAAVEIVAYYVPGLDHLLDALASPLAAITGVLLSASVMVDLPPGLKWPIAVIAGGGIASLTQGATVLTRAKSGLLTGGLGNPVVSTGELAGALALALAAVLLPLLALAVVVLVVLWALRRISARPRGS